MSEGVKMTIKKIMFISVCAFILNGCAGAYGEFYRQVSTAKVENKRIEPKTIVVPDIPSQDTLVKYKLKLLGYSSFVGGYNYETTLDCATAQGSNVGADLVVVVQPVLINSQTRLVPVYHSAEVKTSTETNSNGTYSGTWNSSRSYGEYSGKYKGSSTSTSTSTVEYTTNEYRTFNTYKFHALFLERQDK